MRTLVALVALGLAVAACSEPQPPAGVQVDCGTLSDMACDPAAAAVLRTVAGRGVPVRIALGSGTICRRDAQTCPSPEAPDDGEWIGHATVDFLGASEVGRLNISQSGARFEAVLLGLVPRE